jgi:hypothetical protein
MDEKQWPVLATYSSAFEADFAIEQLESAGIPALRTANDAIGIFGPAFQGSTAFGVAVRVPAALLAEAQAAVSLVGEP